MRAFILLSLFLWGYPSWGEVSKKEKSFQGSAESLDFDHIRKVLERDRLGDIVHEKKKTIEIKRRELKKKKIALYDFPARDDFWGFFSEYWLVKNATILKWNFEKPDYGLEPLFRHFLEEMGLYEIHFKILLLNTPDVTHLALPGNSREVIFLLSVPFIRTLDLSKEEISILLLEDYLRLQRGYFKKYVSLKELNTLLGHNFYKQRKIDVEILKKLSTRYDEIIFDKGFSFQQQFEVTKEMGSMLKNNAKYWNSYYSLLGKIDSLVKSNLLYLKYLKIYPSPELQRGWLRPSRKKVL